MRLCKLILAAVLLAATAFGMTACRGESVLVAGVDIDQMPLSYRDNDNNIVGFEVDMATEAAKRANMTIKIVPINWNQKEELLKSNKINSLWGKLTGTTVEKSNILMTKPYMKNNQIFMISSDSKIAKKEDLIGKTVGTVISSSASLHFKKDIVSVQLANGEMQPYTDANTLFLALQSGQIDAVAVDETMGEYFLNQNTVDYKVLNATISTEEYSVGVRRNDSRLRNSLQTALSSMAKDGTSKEFSNKWFGKDYTLPTG